LNGLLSESREMALELTSSCLKFDFRKRPWLSELDHYFLGVEACGDPELIGVR